MDVVFLKRNLSIVSKDEKRANGVEITHEKTMAKFFSKQIKDANLQIKEGLWTSNKINIKK